jgi:hypothetical protein
MNEKMVEADDTQAVLVDLTKDIVSAYVSHNIVPASELTGLIHDVHGALGSLMGHAVEAPKEEQKPAVPPKEVHHARLSDLSGRRKALQVAQAAPEDPLQPLAGAIPREMGSASRLPDGCSRLCQGALSSCQGDGTGPAPHEVQLTTTRKLAVEWQFSCPCPCLQNIRPE